MMSDFLTSEMSHALAFTLLHSLWQGFIVFTVTIFLLSLISRKNSSARYLITTLGLFTFVIITLATFWIYTPSTQSPITQTQLTAYYTSIVSSVDNSSWNYNISKFIHNNSGWISIIWIVGALFSIIRTITGWLYVNTITSTGLESSELWQTRLKTIAHSLGIQRAVRLVESKLVNSPVVIGVIKPAIVIPVGLSSGLSAEQVEAIFVHELIHIRRHDYLVNVIQCVIESIFFFNPFIWMLSRVIRKEREHCCDDAVISYGTNPKCYVMALASLEETRLAGNGLALSLSGNKNELLNRIKRLMEKSVKNYSLRDRMVPVALLLIGFICASWFTIQRQAEPSQLNGHPNLIVSDTTKKNKKNRLSEKREDTHEQERVEQSYIDEDENSDDMFSVPDPVYATPAFPFDMPEFEIPEFDFEVPDFDHEAFAPDMHIFMDRFDSVPPMIGHEWSAFEEEFRTKFQERFKDFYSKNEKEIEKMLEEMERNQSRVFDESRMAELHARAEDRQRFHEEQQHHFKEQEMHMKDMEHKMKEWEEKHSQQMQAMEKNLKEFESKMKEFDAAVKSELVNDGYMKKGESINNFQWSDDGSIIINGTPIRKEHEEKYRELHKKYFPKMKGRFHYTE